MLESTGSIEQTPHLSFLAFLNRIWAPYNSCISGVCVTVLALGGAGGLDNFQATAGISEGFLWHQSHLSWSWRFRPHSCHGLKAENDHFPSCIFAGSYLPTLWRALQISTPLLYA